MSKTDYRWLHFQDADAVKSPRSGLFVDTARWGRHPNTREGVYQVSLVLRFTGWKRHLMLFDFDSRVGRSRKAYWLRLTLARTWFSTTACWGVEPADHDQLHWVRGPLR